MTTDTTVVNHDERIVKVSEIVEGKETVFYAIRDAYLDYWRSTQPLDDHDAWTRDRRERAEFAIRDDAEVEMSRILAWRKQSRSESLSEAA